jgi:hypothetical protein
MSSDDRDRETKFHLWGWILFLLCAGFFIAGSIIFLIACVIFIIPLVIKGNQGNKD